MIGILTFIYRIFKTLIFIFISMIPDVSQFILRGVFLCKIKAEMPKQSDFFLGGNFGGECN